MVRDRKAQGSLDRCMDKGMAGRADECATDGRLVGVIG
jgi:hypothetical protein